MERYTDGLRNVTPKKLQYAAGVTISAVTHPVDATRCRDRIAQAKPVTIGNDVWLGQTSWSCQG